MCEEIGKACPDCEGTGMDFTASETHGYYKPIFCTTCKGNRRVGATNIHHEEIECTECNGRGWYAERERCEMVTQVQCENCQGRGVL